MSTMQLAKRIVPTSMYAGILLLLSIGCRPVAPTQGEAPKNGSVKTTSSTGAARSPAEVAILLHQYHLSRDYDRLAPLIAKDGREATIRFLKAVDGVLAKKVRLKQVANQRYGDARASTWSMGDIANNLGVFSEHIELINQEFKGTRATVTLQESEHIPLIHVQFEWTEQGWQFIPESIPRAIVAELDKLADHLAEIAESIEQGAEFQAYVNAFVQRLLPQMNRVLSAHDFPIAQVTLPDDMP